jgi:aspartate/methionine/tyrosine aminotransferase
VKFPEVAYLTWAKSLPPVAIDLARSAVECCPTSLLGLQASDLVTSLPATYGYEPLRAAIAQRYHVENAQALSVSGGATYANWIACATILDGCEPSTEVIVEEPTYEPLLRVPQALGHRIRRLDRRAEDGYALDLDKLKSLISPRTRLAIVSNLHNPSGTRIDLTTLRAMSETLAQVDAYLLVDEIYLECMFRERTDSCVHAGPNVVTTNSLTKAYGLDGLRAGWILGPAPLIERAARVNDLMANNSVAPGEQMALAAFRHLDAIGRRAHEILDPNLGRIQIFLTQESRLTATVPNGGTVVFARLPPGIEDDRFTAHLVERYSTLVVPGQFFESPGYIRIGFGCNSELLARGLANLSSALDDLGSA